MKTTQVLTTYTCDICGTTASEKFPNHGVLRFEHEDSVFLEVVAEDICDTCFIKVGTFITDLMKNAPKKAAGSK